MKSPLGIPGRALPAWQNLCAAIEDVEEAGGTIPCRRSDPVLWDGKVAASTEYAIGHCRKCPIQLQCGVYADSAGERVGVWGGRNRSKPAADTEPPTQFDLFNPNTFEESA